MCDALVASREHTRDGILLFAKNSDRKALEAQPFLQFPGATHPPGSRVRCTHVEIPPLPKGVPTTPPKNSDVCALGHRYGGWGKDTPQAVICKDVYGR